MVDDIDIDADMPPEDIDETPAVPRVPHQAIYMSSSYCADDKHAWREIRNRNSREGDSWFMFKGCRHCPATLETVVSHKKNVVGDVIPTVKVYLLTGYGVARPDGKAQTATKEVLGTEVIPQPCEVRKIKG